MLGIFKLYLNICMRVCVYVCILDLSFQNSESSLIFFCITTYYLEMKVL